MNYKNNVLKVNGSELISLMHLLNEEDDIVILMALKNSFEKYPYILDSKSKITITFLDNYKYQMTFERGKGCIYDRKTNI